MRDAGHLNQGAAGSIRSRLWKICNQLNTLDRGCAQRQARAGVYPAQQGDPMKLYCIDDTWDADGYEPYDSVEDFMTMCMRCFGTQPELTRQVTVGLGAGLYTWEDPDGRMVLVESETRPTA